MTPDLKALKELSEKATVGLHKHKLGKYQCDVCCNAAMAKDAFETACVEYVRAQLAAPGTQEGPQGDVVKVMTDKEWASLSAESRHRLNELFAYGQYPAPRAAPPEQLGSREEKEVGK